MSIPTTGVVSISDILLEFTSLIIPVKWSDFYTLGNGIKTSGTIGLGEMRGKSSTVFESYAWPTQSDAHPDRYSQNGDSSFVQANTQYTGGEVYNAFNQYEWQTWYASNGGYYNLYPSRDHAFYGLPYNFPLGNWLIWGIPYTIHVDQFTITPYLYSAVSNYVRGIHLYGRKAPTKYGANTRQFISLSDDSVPWTLLFSGSVEDAVNSSRTLPITVENECDQFLCIITNTGPNAPDGRIGRIQVSGVKDASLSINAWYW